MFLNSNTLIENRRAIEEAKTNLETARNPQELEEAKAILKDLKQERKELLKLEFNL